MCEQTSFLAYDEQRPLQVSSWKKSLWSNEAIVRFPFTPVPFFSTPVKQVWNQLLIQVIVARFINDAFDPIPSVFWLQTYLFHCAVKS